MGATVEAFCSVTQPVLYDADRASRSVGVAARPEDLFDVASMFVGLLAESGSGQSEQQEPGPDHGFYCNRKSTPGQRLMGSG